MLSVPDWPVEPLALLAASPLAPFIDNVRHNLFKPLLLFFGMGFLVPILRVKFDFPQAVYQGLVIYLLVAIGWKGGVELSALRPDELATAAGFMAVGFVTNLVIGVVAYQVLRRATRLRRIDAATVAGYYGSDSAGTFATCQGILLGANLAYASYMPVMLAVMEIPGCLVALYLVASLRRGGLDPSGRMPGESGLAPTLVAAHDHHAHPDEVVAPRESVDDLDGDAPPPKPAGPLSPALLHEVFLNPGLFLLFGGIAVGYVGGLQGGKPVADNNRLFVDLFPAMLGLFLLEMGMTASKHLKDLRAAGPPFILFGLIAPNVFATLGMLAAHAYALAARADFAVGTYVMFAVLCGSASYIAVPAVQRLAIPEASPTLPLAASLGLTFTYNVTIGIPVYIEVAKALMALPGV